VTGGTSFTWYLNGSPVTDPDGRMTGLGTPNLIIEDARLTDDGQYTLVVGSACPDVTSAVAVISIVPLPTAEIIYNGLVLCTNTGDEVVITGTPGAIVTYTINGGDTRTITLSPMGQ